jgi:pimeloyl-ACP methyl ester carboxylesterase
MWLDVDGGRLKLHTSGSGAPFLLLHGWPLDHRIFEPQVRHLERSFRVTVFDRRGFGESKAPPDLTRELDDIDSILDALEIETVHLLGMSQGARIALRYSVTRPARIRSLILQAPVVDGLLLDQTDNERIPIEDFADLARDGRLDEVRRRWLAHPMMSLNQGQERLRRDIEQIVNAYQGRDLLAYSPANLTVPYDVLAQLSGFEKPCLILTGEHETATRREHARRLREVLPRAREIVFRHSGHLSNLLEPETYNREVAAFCASVEASPGRDRPAGALRNWRS